MWAKAKVQLVFSAHCKWKKNRFEVVDSDIACRHLVDCLCHPSIRVVHCKYYVTRDVRIQSHNLTKTLQASSSLSIVAKRAKVAQFITNLLFIFEFG